MSLNTNSLTTPTATTEAGAAARVKAVLIVDAKVAGYQDLLADLAADTALLVLDGEQDGVLQIAAFLAGYQGLGSIQIVSHGGAGALVLGAAELNAAQLEHYAPALAQWGAALAEGGDILLYGCAVAAGADGKIFVDALAARCGADVSASTDASGGAANWILEYQSGQVDSVSVLDATAQAYYNSLLAQASTSATYNASAKVLAVFSSGFVTGSGTGLALNKLTI